MSRLPGFSGKTQKGNRGQGTRTSLAGRILIARRQAKASLGLVALLEKSGYELWKAETASRAVDFLHDSPSLLLLEAELIQDCDARIRNEIAGICRNGDIPCLLYSSQEVPRADLEEMAPWASEFICHPRDSGEALAWVRNQLTIMRLRRRLESAYGKLQATRTELEEGLRSAAHIQECLVPDQPPALDQIRMDWSYLPSARVGGDLFNVQRLDERTLMAYIFDVSGHGVSSAMVAVAVSQTLSTEPGQVLKKKIESPPYYEITSPSEVLEVLDRAYPFELFEMFFTMCYLLIDIHTGEIRYSNAAHPPPVLMRGDGSRELLRDGGTIIGLREGIPFETGRTEMRPGDRLYLYTDGIIEHSDPDGNLYGDERLFRQLNRLRGRRLETVNRKVIESLQSFNLGSLPEDDVTLLGIEFRSEQP